MRSVHFSFFLVSGQTLLDWLPDEKNDVAWTFSIYRKVKILLFLINISNHSLGLFSSRITDLHTDFSCQSLIFSCFWLFLVLSWRRRWQITIQLSTVNGKLVPGFLTLENMRTIIFYIAWQLKGILAYGLFYSRDSIKCYSFPIRSIENDFNIISLRYLIKWLQKLGYF